MGAMHESLATAGQIDGDTAASRDAFIGNMRCVANAVSVVTTDGAAGRHGATVSAFCSVSADPPTVLVCLKTDSRIARLVKANGVLALNVLGAEQSPLAVRFAGGEDASLTAVQGRSDGVCDRFVGVALDARFSQPVLTGAIGFCGVVRQMHDAGSHTVCIAEVEALAQSDAQPLVYHDGGYQRIAPVAQEPQHG